jgi:hypothetical protein
LAGNTQTASGKIKKGFANISYHTLDMANRIHSSASDLFVFNVAAQQKLILTGLR